MFGHFQRKREKKRLKKDKAAFQSEVDRFRQSQQNPISQERSLQQDVNTLANEQKGRDRLARQEGREDFEELMNRDYPGLTSNQRQNYTESSNAQINKDLHGY